MSDKNVGSIGAAGTRSDDTAARTDDTNVGYELMPAAPDCPRRPTSTRRARRPAAVDAARGQPGAVGHANLKSALHRVLEILARHHGAVRGMVTLLHETASCTSRRRTASDDRARRSATGSAKASPARSSRAASRSSCRASAASRRSCNRAARRPELPQQELSFICVPILLNRQAVGALGVDLRVQGRSATTTAA